MWTIIGWSVAVVLILGVAVVVLYVRSVPSEPSALMAQYRTTMTHVNDAFAEQHKRGAREQQLIHLRTDIDHAKRLMELENEAKGLRARYARGGSQGSQFSPEVEEALRRIFEEIDSLKYGSVS